jgi:hypothetical protein
MNYPVKPIIETNDKILNAFFPHLRAHEIFKRFIEQMQKDEKEPYYENWSRDLFEDHSEVK